MSKTEREVNRLAGRANSIANDISQQLRHIMGQIHDNDPATATGADALLLSVWASLSRDRDNLRILADDIIQTGEMIEGGYL